MQRLERTISIFIFSGIISCLAVSYSFKISQPRTASAETMRLLHAQESIIESKIVNINTAGRYQLTKLPGIGPKLADRIVKYRDEHGPFSSCEDIKKVKGIGEKKYQAIFGMITVSD
jgi:comEA protein